MSRKPIKIFIVEDHPLTVKGVKDFLEEQSGISVVGEALSLKEAIAKAPLYSPEIIILDISLADENGLELIRHLGKALPQTKYLVHSMHLQKGFVREAIRAGASGYVLKDAPPEELLRAIHALHKGHRYYCPQLEHLAIDNSDEYHLTLREKEILRCLISGMKMAEIARRSSSSYYTITSHCKNIYKKLNVHSRGIAVAKAMEEHLC
ncbi:MAG: response regulator transcription factor [bacterium]